MSLPYAYYAATLCKKPEQTYERILRSSNNERTNGRTNGRTDGRTNESEFVGPNSAPRGTKNQENRRKKITPKTPVTFNLTHL